MAEQTPAEQELAALIVEALHLDGVRPEDIEPEAALFREGLGLDSIDALELAYAIGQRYGVQLRSDDADNARIFASLRALSDFIGRQRSG